MRVIAIGCEYSGVTTLLNGLLNWGRPRGINFHLDDHFTIPDAFHLSEEEQQAMLNMLPGIKERLQRFQIVYHVRLVNHYEHILLGGFHIEEEIYGPLYYYPGLTVHETRKYETEMPADTLLVHLKADAATIAARMDQNLHPHTLIQRPHIAMLQERFAQEYAASWIEHKIQIDTTDLPAEELLHTFLTSARPHLATADMLRLLAEQLDHKS